MKHYLITDHFFKDADKLRNVFEDNFKNPKADQRQRFVWDYFPEKIYASLHSQMVQWGREVLGCHDISPPWMSYYVEGMKQDLHSDVPHGPWAFVFSLTPKKRVFKGGETLILKPTTLNYWPHFQDQEDRELNSFVERIPANFNRLTVFDPRFPHGVTEVTGTHDPLEARLVIHGWFVEPRPYVVGSLSTAQAQKTIDQGIFQVSEAMEEVGPMHGTVSIRLAIAASGDIQKVVFLTNTLVGLQEDQFQRKVMNKFLLKTFKALKFPKTKGSSQITIPILFK